MFYYVRRILRSIKSNRRRPAAAVWLIWRIQIIRYHYHRSIIIYDLQAQNGILLNANPLRERISFQKRYIILYLFIALLLKNWYWLSPYRPTDRFKSIYFYCSHKICIPMLLIFINIYYYYFFFLTITRLLQWLLDIKVQCIILLVVLN